MTDPKEIWLEPACATDSYEGRQWCESDVWGVCEEVDCQLPPVKYTRTDIAKDAERAAYQRGLEDAAKRVEGMSATADFSLYDDIAAAIRALCVNRGE